MKACELFHIKMGIFLLILSAVLILTLQHTIKSFESQSECVTERDTDHIKDYGGGGGWKSLFLNILLKYPDILGWKPLF